MRGRMLRVRANTEPSEGGEVDQPVLGDGDRRPRLSPWRFVLAFGVISLLMDVVYEGARSVTGPILFGLGASAGTVGAVTGAGEAVALGLRFVSGPLADRTARFWAWTLAGYALTALSVPLLGFAGALPVAGVLVIAERVGKAVRSPSKDTLLSHATAPLGRGRGFAVHEAIDQVGAVAGPLAVAGVLAWTGSYRWALGVLVLPAVAALGLLVALSRRVPDPAQYDPDPDGGTEASGPSRWSWVGGRLPETFWWHAAFTAATTAGTTTFGVLSFHLVEKRMMTLALVPVLYALAMAVDAVAALLNGWGYDRFGPATLAALPVLSASALLGFSSSTGAAVLGVLCWAAALGLQESTLRAFVADTVPRDRRATAFGIYAGILGVAMLLGGTLTGFLYAHSVRVLVLFVLVIQAAALGVLAYALGGRRAAR